MSLIYDIYIVASLQFEQKQRDAVPEHERIRLMRQIPDIARHPF